MVVVVESKGIKAQTGDRIVAAAVFVLVNPSAGTLEGGGETQDSILGWFAV